MNEKFRKDLDEQLSFIGWAETDTQAVLRQTTRKGGRGLRTAVVLAAAIALTAALACVGYAEYHSGLLSSLFGGRGVRPDAEQLMVFEPVELTKNGIIVSITEYLNDGQTLYMAGEMRNDTDEALLCGMKALMGGSGSGVFSANDLVLIEPGETAQGIWRVETDMGSFEVLLREIENEYGGMIEIQAAALKPKETPVELANHAGYYARDMYYDTELAEKVFDETVSFPMERNRAARPSRTAPGVKEVGMEEFGYRIVMRRANFAVASSQVEFEIIPDNREDILAFGDEGADGHGPLYRWYELLDADGNRLFAGLTGGATFGWDERQTKLVYAFDYLPLDSVPEQIVLVPRNDDGTYVMDEAVSIPVIPG